MFMRREKLIINILIISKYKDLLERQGLIGEVADFQVLHLQNWRDTSLRLLKQCFAIVMDESLLENDIISFFKRVTIYNGISIIVTSFQKNYKNLLETITLGIKDYTIRLKKSLRRPDSVKPLCIYI